MSVVLRRSAACWCLAALLVLTGSASAQKKAAASTEPPPPLVEAVQRGDQAAVEALLRDGADVDAADARGATGLLWAAMQGDGTLARLLLDAGAEPHPPGAIVPEPGGTAYYGSPLAAAVARDHLHVMRLLVDEGGADVGRPEWNPEEEAFTGWTPLHYAAALGQAEALAYLLERGVDTEARDRFGFTPLARAVRNGMDATVRGLLDAGADLTVTDDEGNPLLLLAANRGHRGTALLLLDAGADPNAGDPRGFRPLHMAAVNGWTVMIDRLLDAGADIEAREPSEGATPVMVAIVKNELEAFERLLERGADLEARDDKGHTVLLHTAMNGDPAFLEVILARGADLQARSDFRETALHVALVTEQEDMALRLIEAGANVRARDRALWAPIHYAARDGWLRIVGALREAGASIHTTKSDGWTPLHLVAHNGDLTLTQVFLCEGADPKARTKRGQTPDSLAQARGHERIRLLLAAPQCSWAVEASDERRAGQRLEQAGRYTEALPRFERARRANELLLGPEHPHTITALMDLADVHLAQGDEGRYESLIAEAERRLDGQSDALPALAVRVYNARMAARFMDSDYAEAERYLQEALRLYDSLGGSPTGRATFLLNLGRLRTRSGDPGGAFDALQEAEQQVRAAELDAASRLRFFAELSVAYDLIDQPDAAGVVFEEAMALVERLGLTRTRPTGTTATSLDLPTTVSVLERLGLSAARASVLRGADHAAQAQALALRAATLRIGLLMQNLNQPQADLQHLLHDRDVVDLLLSFARDPDVLPEAYAYLARWKGLLLFAIRQQSLAMRPAEEDRVYGDAVWQIEALREQLVAWQQRAATTDEAAWLAEQQALVARKNALERDLLRSASPAAKADPLPHPDRLRDRLAADEALLDIYRYRDYTDGLERYGAILLTAQAPPVYVALGEAATLDRHLADWRAAVLAQRGDADTWQAMAEALWAPTRDVLPTTVRKLWVSPDGALGRLPWSRFAAEEGSPTRLLLAQVDAPRELAALLTSTPASGTATGGGQDRVLLVGDVDFGAGTTPFAPLPGTAREVAALEALARREGVRPVVLVGEAPDKIALTDRLDAHAYVHLATHGFFWASAAALAERRAASRSGSLAGAEENAAASRPEAASRLPLLESGLAVTNANAGANGLLTAEELIGLDLSAVEVMVLSACDTGRGTEVTGQGVLGLRAALATAGVRTLLLSLWPVPDASTALLMERFYEGLWSDGLAPAEALRQAQEALQQDPRYAAPVHWAAWVLAGEGW